MFVFDGLVFHFDNEFRAFQNEEKSAKSPTALKLFFWFFLWTLPPLHQHISDFALLVALGLHHIKLEDTQRMSLKSILLWRFHMFWRRSSEFKVRSSKHLSSFE